MSMLLNVYMTLTLSPREAEKPASATVTNSRKVKIPACKNTGLQVFDLFP